MTAAKRSEIRAIRGIGIGIALFGLLFLIILAIPQNIRYYHSMKRAAPVTATIVDTSSSQYSSKYYYSGAGDDVETYTKIYTSYSYVITYTYQGKEYTSTCEKYLGSEGEQVEVLIDTARPELVVSDDNNGWFALKCSLFLFGLSAIVFGVAYAVKKFEDKKDKRRKR